MKYWPIALYLLVNIGGFELLVYSSDENVCYCQRGGGNNVTSLQYTIVTVLLVLDAMLLALITRRFS